jgi:hypothetical protein
VILYMALQDLQATSAWQMWGPVCLKYMYLLLVLLYRGAFWMLTLWFVSGGWPYYSIGEWPCGWFCVPLLVWFIWPRCPCIGWLRELGGVVHRGRQTCSSLRCKQPPTLWKYNWN